MQAPRLNSLDLLRPAFRNPLELLLRDLAAESIPLLPFETGRTPSRQNALYARGRDPNAPDFGRTVTRAQAYESAHEYGLGTDLVFRINGAWTWDEPSPGMWDRMHQMARLRGLEILQRPDGRIIEEPHVQLGGFDWRGMERGPMDDAGWLAWLQASIGSAPGVG